MNTNYIIHIETGCWLYTRKLSNGYAREWNNTKQKAEMVHISNYEEKFGPVPTGMELDHVKEKCKFRHCINPDHVEPVSHLENVLRGRNTKITKEQAKEIEEIFRLNPRTEIYDVAKKYGVHRSTIWRLLRKKSPRYGSINILGGRKLRSDGKLTIENIIEIKMLSKTENYTQISKRFGVTSEHVSRIVRNLAGKDIQQ